MSDGLRLVSINNWEKRKFAGQENTLDKAINSGSLEQLKQAHEETSEILRYLEIM